MKDFEYFNILSCISNKFFYLKCFYRLATKYDDGLSQQLKRKINELTILFLIVNIHFGSLVLNVVVNLLLEFFRTFRLQ